MNNEMPRKNAAPRKLVFLTLIAGRKRKDALLTALSASGLKVINTLYGKGTVEAGYLQNALGLIPEENKIIIVGLMRLENADAVFDILVKKFDFDKPNTGIAFTIPIEKLSF